MTDVPPPPPPPPPPPGSEPGGEPEPSDASYAYPPPPPSAVFSPYAPWWRRAIAAVLDWFLVAVPVGVLGAVFGLVEVVRNVDGDLARVDVSTGMSLLVFAAACIYSGVLEGGPRGATVGKMALLIQVRDATTGGAIGFGRALGRRFIFLILFELLFFPGAINALWPLWDPRRQGWHDKAVKSVVVNAPRR